MESWRQWWWVVLSATFLLIFYPFAILHKKREIGGLLTEIREKEGERWLAQQEQEELQLRLRSESDPSWVEMLLIRDLGVVPEGWLKVHFSK